MSKNENPIDDIAITNDFLLSTIDLILEDNNLAKRFQQALSENNLDILSRASFYAKIMTVPVLLFSPLLTEEFIDKETKKTQKEYNKIGNIFYEALLDLKSKNIISGDTMNRLGANKFAIEMGLNK
jgi:hypothetical protein